jgi:hypothetical protein
MELYERMSELREINETLKAKKDALEATKKEDEDQIVKGTEWYKHSIRKKEVKRDGFHEKIESMQTEMVELDEEHKAQIEEIHRQYKSKLDCFHDDFIELQSKETTLRNAVKEKEHIMNET